MIRKKLYNTKEYPMSVVINKPIEVRPNTIADTIWNMISVKSAISQDNANEEFYRIMQEIESQVTAIMKMNNLSVDVKDHLGY
jgi:hypothetical protein